MAKKMSTIVQFNRLEYAPGADCQHLKKLPLPCTHRFYPHWLRVWDGASWRSQCKKGIQLKREKLSGSSWRCLSSFWTILWGVRIKEWSQKQHGRWWRNFGLAFGGGIWCVPRLWRISWNRTVQHSGIGQRWQSRPTPCNILPMPERYCAHITSFARSSLWVVGWTMRWKPWSSQLWRRKWSVWVPRSSGGSALRSADCTVFIASHHRLVYPLIHIVFLICDIPEMLPNSSLCDMRNS